MYYRGYNSGELVTCIVEVTIEAGDRFGSDGLVT